MPKSTRRRTAVRTRHERDTRLIERVAELGFDQTVRFAGYDYEGRTLHVHHRTAHHLVVKVGGGSCWAGRGEREYQPARFEVYDIVGGSGNRLVVESIIHFPLKSERHDELPDVSRRPFGKRFP